MADQVRLTGRALTNLRKKVFNEYGRVCVMCGVEYEEKDLHVDHIVPFVAGGTYEMDNLQVLCSKHNLEKGKKEGSIRVTWINSRWLDPKEFV